MTERADSYRGFRPPSMPQVRIPSSCAWRASMFWATTGKRVRRRLQPLLDNGVVLMKHLTGATSTEGPQRMVDQISNYPLRQSVAFWHLGDHLGRQREIKTREAELAKFRESIAAIRGFDDEISRLATANVEGELPLFARVPSGSGHHRDSTPHVGLRSSLNRYIRVYEPKKTADGAVEPRALFLGLGPGNDTFHRGAQHLG